MQNRLRIRTAGALPISSRGASPRQASKALQDKALRLRLCASMKPRADPGLDPGADPGPPRALAQRSRLGAATAAWPGFQGLEIEGNALSRSSPAEAGAQRNEARRPADLGPSFRWERARRSRLIKHHIPRFIPHVILDPEAAAEKPGPDFRSG